MAKIKAFLGFNILMGLVWMPAALEDYILEKRLSLSQCSHNIPHFKGQIQTALKVSSFHKKCIPKTKRRERL